MPGLTIDDNVKLFDRIVPRSALEWGRLTSGRCYQQKVVQYPETISCVVPWEIDGLRVNGVLYQAKIVEGFDQWESWA